MPGFVLHQDATVTCKHFGPASPTLPIVNPRVKVSGMAVITQTENYTVTGCLKGNSPCVSAQWLTAAARVRVSGRPVILKDSLALSAPSPEGLDIFITQQRVKGS